MTVYCRTSSRRARLDDPDVFRFFYFERELYRAIVRDEKVVSVSYRRSPYYPWKRLQGKAAERVMGVVAIEKDLRNGKSRVYTREKERDHGN